VRASLRRALLVGGALVVLVAGCRSVAPEHAGALNPRLGELLLVGFHGTTLQGTPHLDSLLCEARVAGASSSRATSSTRSRRRGSLAT